MGCSFFDGYSLFAKSVVSSSASNVCVLGDTLNTRIASKISNLFLPDDFKKARKASASVIMDTFFRYAIVTLRENSVWNSSLLSKALSKSSTVLRTVTDSLVSDGSGFFETVLRDSKSLSCCGNFFFHF